MQLYSLILIYLGIIFGVSLLGSMILWYMEYLSDFEKKVQKMFVISLIVSGVVFAIMLPIKIVYFPIG